MARTKSPPLKRVPLRASALFRVKSPKRCAELLFAEVAKLRGLADGRDNYVRFQLKGREIQNPKPALKALQKRFTYLLSQIETPDYLHSGVKKRSYITNSSPHCASTKAVKVDVKKFYPSARSAEVYRFLTEKLEWKGDVAGLLTTLLTVDGHLPTGGNASPLLSFWAYRPMFDEIDDLARSMGCVFTLYVDDMTLSGGQATRSLMYEVRKAVGRSRLIAHKMRCFQTGQPRVITGVAKTVSGQRLPIKRQVEIRNARLAVRNAKTDSEQVLGLSKLIGRLFEAAEVDPDQWSALATATAREHRQLNRRIMSKPFVTKAGVQIEPTSVGDPGPPWEN